MARSVPVQTKFALLGTLLASTLCGQSNAGKPVDFQREVRPILSDNCFHCHGPDSGTRMAGLRLDLKDAALEVRKRGAAIVPGKSAESLLYMRVIETNAARRMPPESSHKTLTPAQITTLRRWIDTGANWKEHWAFIAPVSPKLPSVRNASWVRNPVDRFILARLESQKLAPATPADKRTLIRRVALDLTGLPPRPAEIELFLKDLKPDAYERMIDRYLASPHYGEHRARYWLDAARYADTHGIHIDNYREIWPYRDWVIKAINQNVPFNQFTIEQLAGDLLPNATLEQQIATGFHRCNATTSEGGAIDDEYAEIYAKDRADTTGAVWLGMTVGCATCHDHKFDPISQKDFYALGAFFRNTPQRPMDGNVKDTPPYLLVPRPEDRTEWEHTQQRLDAIRNSMQEMRKTSAEPFEKWLQQRSVEMAASPVENPKSQIYAAAIDQLSRPATVTLGVSRVAGRPALHFEKDNGVPDKFDPKATAEKPFSVSATFLLPEKLERGYTIASQQDGKDKGRGWSLEVNRRSGIFRLTGDDGKGIDIRSVNIENLVPGTWNHLVGSYDGGRKQSGLSLYVNGRTVITQGRGAPDLEGALAPEEPLMLGRSLAGGALGDLRIFDRVVTEAEAKLLSEWPAIETALAKPAADLNDADRSALLSWYLARHDEPYRKLGHELAEVTETASMIENRGTITHVMHETPGSRPYAHILFRGAYDQKRERVEAATPSVLPPMSPDLPRNRLGFAQWLFTDSNPMTARVTVNRMWQEVFGTGLVKTADDFGSQGQTPSHPELLDWLAIDFRQNGWDVKRFYKQLLLSSTYRQAALATPAKLAKDPENRLLSRGPRFRMDAEMVRDYALASSGLLSRGIGGPSARPYQPEGIWEAVAMKVSNTRFYKQDHGEGLYRRSMYSFWKRSAPPASMDIFNGPTRESCVVRRERTNTPLQALVTMNDVQFVEAARVLAERAMQTANAYDGRLAFLSESVLGRPLTLAENRIIRKSFDGFHEYYGGHSDDAAKLLNAGERKPDPSLPAADFAALTMVATQLFNLDEVLNK